MQFMKTLLKRLSASSTTNRTFRFWSCTRTVLYCTVTDLVYEEPVQTERLFVDDVLHASGVGGGTEGLGSAPVLGQGGFL